MNTPANKNLEQRSLTSVLDAGTPGMSGTPVFSPPDEPADTSSLLDLAYQQYCREKGQGNAPDPDAFCAQFPGMKSSLKRLVEAHLFLEQDAESQVATSANRPKLGDIFSGFLLQRELGKGSFATVYLATEPMLGNRDVVVKISMHGAWEADILGRINHRHIVPIHSVRVDKATGLTVVCMPYLGSATLRHVLERILAGAKPPTHARAILEAVREPGADASKAEASPFLENGTFVDGICQIGAQLADALAFIHERGICHRDLKPSNVLMTPAGHPMLLDFNLSTDAGNSATRQGGTLPYMSPEQLLAFDQQGARDVSLLDPRSDIFSLGVILHELLTGSHPFGPLPLKMSHQQLRRQLLERQRATPPLIHQLNSEVDKPLSRLLAQCLAYNPNDRPQSAADIAVALRRAMSPWRRGMRWVRRHPRKLLAAAAATITLVVCGFLFWSLRPPLSVREFREGVTQHRQGQYRQAVEPSSISTSP
ncbi:MAG: serine/threonine protein kinase [Planctomycetes bacterium]|nr:serine/threonine protein kinase [Planctomycetota bacterium]